MDSDSDSDDDCEDVLIDRYPLISDPFEENETDPEGIITSEIDELFDIDGLSQPSLDNRH